MIFFSPFFSITTFDTFSITTYCGKKNFAFQKEGGMFSVSSASFSVTVSPPPPSLTHAFPLRRNFGEELIAKSVEANSLPCVPSFIACDTISYISAHSHTTINV